MILRQWKRCFWVFLTLIFLILCSIQSGRLFTAFAADEPRIVRVGVYDNRPKVYLDDKKVAVGVFPDILNYIAKQENWRITFVPGTWEEGLNRLEEGEIDIMPDVAVSAERQQKYDFSNETILSSWGGGLRQKKFQH